MAGGGGVLVIWEHLLSAHMCWIWETGLVPPVPLPRPKSLSPFLPSFFLFFPIGLPSASLPLSSLQEVIPLDLGAHIQRRTQHCVRQALVLCFICPMSVQDGALHIRVYLEPAPSTPQVFPHPCLERHKCKGTLSSTPLLRC